ncbi:hypothetical protein [Providencia sp. Me31A]|uniref:hypothetical protein n=1 Tax=Providencia sp. Me31A TaxID=3392637 RepID=UPI003D284A4D
MKPQAFSMGLDTRLIAASAIQPSIDNHDQSMPPQMLTSKQTVLANWSKSSNSLCLPESLWICMAPLYALP